MTDISELRKQDNEKESISKKPTQLMTIGLLIIEASPVHFSLCHVVTLQIRTVLLFLFKNQKFAIRDAKIVEKKIMANMSCPAAKLSLPEVTEFICLEILNIELQNAISTFPLPLLASSSRICCHCCQSRPFHFSPTPTYVECTSMTLRYKDP